MRSLKRGWMNGVVSVRFSVAVSPTTITAVVRCRIAPGVATLVDVECARLTKIVRIYLLPINSIFASPTDAVDTRSKAKCPQPECCFSVCSFSMSEVTVLGMLLTGVGLGIVRPMRS